MWDPKFWMKHTDWPMDSAGHVFLARAFGSVGRAIFGEEWKGLETYVEIHDPKAKPNEWAITGSEKSARSLIKRRNAVIAAIVKGCETGVLQSEYRERAGGATMPIPSVWWNTERIAQRFRMCQINPKDPFSLGIAGDGFCWIYLAAESLDRFLVALPNSRERVGFDFHLSPYLATMHAVARKMKITPDNQPTKEEIMAELRATWTAPVKLSQNLEKAMATLLREVESQGGRANKPVAVKKVEPKAMMG
jgi:hypothetical protein